MSIELQEPETLSPHQHAIDHLVDPQVYESMVLDATIRLVSVQSREIIPVTPDTDITLGALRDIQKCVVMPIHLAKLD